MNSRNYFMPPNPSAGTVMNNSVNSQPQNSTARVIPRGQPLVAYEYSSNPHQPVCTKCRGHIVDETYLQIGGQIYHKGCLRCSFCKKLLPRDERCYLKAGSAICAFDYERYVVDRCARCRKILSMDSWLRKVHGRLYHVSCFSCDTCHRILQEHDQYTIVKTKIFCRPTCCPSEIEPSADGVDVTDSFCAAEAVQQSSESVSSTPAFTNFPVTAEHNHWAHGLAVSEASAVVTNRQSHVEWPFCSQGSLRSGYPSLLGAGGRTRFSQDPLNPGDYSLRAPTFAQLRFRSQQAATMPHCCVPRAPDCRPAMFQRYARLAQINGPVVRCCEPRQHSHNAEKLVRRVRTNFSDEQMLILQNSFDSEPNPDTHDLESIANATGLSKRVTQVWFQNCRARIRRSRENRQVDSSLSAEVSGQSACSSLDTSCARDASTPVTQAFGPFQTPKCTDSGGASLENEVQIENMDPKETTSHAVKRKSTIEDS